ncbi:MAG TPA: hypothetical protein VK996_04925 [Ramlibacter sp.]|nr:hypothetical protein [Ramlibacter sp.]
MTAEDALSFVEQHGVVLVSANGAAPKLAEAIAGEAIKGSWWAHPQGPRIFNVLGAVTDSADIAVCRLLDGKVTLVHRRMWPALVRLADGFEGAQLAQVQQEHTASGRHVNHETPYPAWVPPEVVAQGRAMTEQDALALFGAWLPTPAARKARKVAKR